ncbi:SdpI family protein [uncultured Planktosalinus sp.]|uniref:SdpI family protein n=1 Tax=uncultured Planktosalinus sp. TaxID=1810935 RepID=UPI0030D75A5E
MAVYWSNLLFITLGSSGIIFLIAGYIMLKYPPKNINHFYGYRTRRSMESKEKWDFAQIFSAREMIKQAWYMISIAIMGLFLNPEEMFSMFLSIGFIIFSVVIMLFKTEKKLKQKFN